MVEVTAEGEEVRAASPESPKFPKTLILSQYICNFGNVVKGKSPRMKFDVMNRGFLNISFIIPKLKGTPFFIEPDRVKDLPGTSFHLKALMNRLSKSWNCVF